jgi:hypothetical protein
MFDGQNTVLRADKQCRELVQQYCGASKIIWSTAILLIAENHVFLQYLSSNYGCLR